MLPFFEEEMKRIEESIEDYRGGIRRNVAIISEPYYGEADLMARAASVAGPDGLRIDGRRLRHDFGILERAPQRIVVVDEAHRLSLRKIGSFDLMDRFLRFVTSEERLFITTWNSFSWRYLEEVLGIGRHFPRQIILPRLDAGQIREMLLAGREEGELTFVEEEAPGGDSKVLEWRVTRRAVMGHNIDLSYPSVDPGVIRSRLKRNRKEKKSGEDAFFERLAQISDGNPGVAEHLWKEALNYPEVRSSLRDPPTIDLDFDESFVLGVVLSSGSLELDELSEVLGPMDLSAETMAALLEEKGLVSIDGGVVTLRAEALKSDIEHERRLRLV